MLPGGASEALLGCLVRACQPPVGDGRSRPLAISALRDAAAVAGLGRSALILALTHLGAGMEAAAEQLGMMLLVSECGGGGAGSSSSSSGGTAAGSGFGGGRGRGAAAGGGSAWFRGRAAAAASTGPLRERRHAVQAAARKLHFLTVWVNEQDEAVLLAVHAAAEGEWRHHSGALRGSGAAAGGGMVEGEDGKEAGDAEIGRVVGGMLPQPGFMGSGAGMGTGVGVAMGGLAGGGRGRPLIEELD